jgi:hypothetical protein
MTNSLTARAGVVPERLIDIDLGNHAVPAVADVARRAPAAIEHE